MIEYVEIRDAGTKTIGIIDTAASIIWHSVYFGVGDFEIYAAATPEIIALLLTGQYVTRPDNREVGIIERIAIQDDEAGARMIVASGRFVKSILDRRLIYKLSGSTNTPTILRGNVENEVRTVVYNNAIACEFDSKRNIDILELGEVANIPLRIVDSNGNAAQKQVSYGNLLEYTDALLEEYGIAATCILRNNKFQYILYRGVDRSKDNTDGNAPIVFSEEFDNLISNNYTHDTQGVKNAALIGGEGEGVQRYYSMLETPVTGLQRREMWIDAGSISRTYKDDSETEQTYTDAEYKIMLDAKGKQDLAPLVASETFDGVIDVTNGNYIFGRDFALGDVVTVQDKDIGKYINVRIREAIETQDTDGYSVEVIYQ
jgi:hypothetical protein